MPLSVFRGALRPYNAPLDPSALRSLAPFPTRAAHFSFAPGRPGGVCVPSPGGTTRGESAAGSGELRGKGTAGRGQPSTRGTRGLPPRGQLGEERPGLAASARLGAAPPAGGAGGALPPAAGPGAPYSPPPAGRARHASGRLGGAERAEAGAAGA